jgi:hypothetical protein
MKYMDKRSIEEILANPQEDDIVPATALGYRAVSINHIWQSCPSCGQFRWITNSYNGRFDNKGNKRYCKLCAEKYKPLPHNGSKKKYSLYATREYKIIKATDIPKVGDLIYGEDIKRHKGSIYRWSACPLCGECRWVIRDSGVNRTCIHCMGKGVSRRIGEIASNWKGGRTVNTKGYVRVILRADDPYYAMVDNDGYVFEHRLVVAKSLGRCLESWEIVHHKHTRFPIGSKEDKGDNRIENLELIANQNTHHIITLLETKVRDLMEDIESLRKQIMANEWRIKELELVNRESKSRT